MRAETIELGIADLAVPPGTHLCGFYRGSDERRDIVVPYVDAGLTAGDRCLCAVDEMELPAWDVEGSQLDIRSPRDIYLGRGEFLAAEMMRFWEAWASAALSGTYTVARVLGEMTWAVQEVIGPANLIAYESELNRFAPRYPQVLLCLYDLEKFGGALLVDVVRTHPKVLMGTTVVENLYHVPPDQLIHHWS
jgi:hypothetical protein